MKEVILIILHVVFFLVVRGNTGQCPDCIIPCTPTPDLNITKTLLLQTFHHQIRDYTLRTILDAIYGDVRFMSSNGGEVLSKTILINGYTMSDLCFIFSNTPELLQTSPFPKIQFRYFPAQILSDIDEAKNFYLFKKISLLSSENRRINTELDDITSRFNILNYTLYEEKEETLQSETSLSLRKIEMRKKLEYAIIDARVYGTTMVCVPSS